MAMGQSQFSDDLMQDLLEARKIQMSMLPQSVPQLSGFQVAAYSLPAIAVGGDFYDFIGLNNYSTGIVIGDAMGHGIAAALLMSMALTEFRWQARREMSASLVLNNVNFRLSRNMRTRALVSSVYTTIDHEHSRMTCAMAGMRPWFINSKSHECFPIKPSGERFPLGVSPKSEYQSSDISMAMGDALVFYTDGILEAINENNEIYGFERLERMLTKNSNADAQSILDAVLLDLNTFIGKHPQEDDITVVVLKAADQFLTEPVFQPSRFVSGERKSVTTLFALWADKLSGDSVRNLKMLLKSYGGLTGIIGENSLVSLFGVPNLHEDDSERAIVAAQAMKNLCKSTNFQMGINTDTMIVKPSSEIDYNSIGEPTNIALHLANNAQSGQILVNDNAHRQTYNAFHFSDAIEISSPYEDKPLAVYSVEAYAERPRSVRGIKGVYAPTIGREKEMEKISICVDDLLSGKGQVVSITGEAGIGKSRLLDEMRKYAGDRVRWLDGRCISYGQSMNYCPFRSILASYMEFLPTDSDDEIKEKLKQRVNALLPYESKWNPITVGSIFFPQYELQLRLASGDDIARRITYPIMRELFHKVSDEKPLVLAFEDLHWADPSSVALLDFLMDSVDDAPIIYVWAYRPYRESGCWQLREKADREFEYCHTKLDLLPLANEQTDKLLDKLLNISNMPDYIREIIQKKSVGNPLFVEEIVRSFIDTDINMSDDVWHTFVKSAKIIQSDTLQGVILARVDELDTEAKEIMQIASVIGESFSISLLKEVTEAMENLSINLRELERFEMVQRRRIDNDWEYRFRHPLIYEVVYNSLLPEDKTILHEKVGKAIEKLYGDRLDDHLEPLSWHFGNSNDIDRAIHYSMLAGEKAHAISSYWEALDYYDIALEKAEKLPLDMRKKELFVDLILKRFFPLHMMGRLEQSIEELEKYLGWTEEINNKDYNYIYYLELAEHYSTMGNIAQLRRCSEKLNDKTILMQAHFLDAKYEEILESAKMFLAFDIDIKSEYITELNDGKMPDAIKEKYESFMRTKLSPYYSLTIEAKDKAWKYIGNDSLLILYVKMEDDKINIYISYYYYTGMALARLGRWEESLMCLQYRLDFAQVNKLSTNYIFAVWRISDIYLDMGEWEKAIDECQKLLDMSISLYIKPHVIVVLGWAYCKVGRLDEGIYMLEHWKADSRKSRRGPLLDCNYSLALADGYFMQGDIEKALSNVELALQIAVEQGYPLHEARSHRIMGEILTKTDFSMAENHLLVSVEITKRIKARNEEGITELSWGCACLKNNDIDKARKHLNKSKEIFNELKTTRYIELATEILASVN
jgi:tetratricopeptide (TPR) repeat protein